MSNEIDRLEIVVEAEANKASRSLSGMEKHLDKIASSLEKVVALTTGLDKIGNLDFFGMEKFKKEMDSIFRTQKKMSRVTRGPRIDRSDLKYTEKSLDDLFDKFKDVGRNIDFSGQGLTELQSGLKNAEAQATRLNERLDKKISLEGTDKLGKSWESLVYDIQKATNQAEGYREAIERIKKETSALKITHWDDFDKKSTGSEIPKVTDVSPGSMNYNPDAMSMVFGEEFKDIRNLNDLMKQFGGSAQQAGRAINQFENSMETEKVNTYESRIKSLKKELGGLAFQGFKQGDTEYDTVAKQLARLTAEKKKYDKSIGLSKTEALSSKLSKVSAVMKEAGVNAKKLGSVLKEAFLLPVRFGQSAVKALSKVGNRISSITKSAKNMAKAFATPISQLGKLKNALLPLM